MLIGCGVDNVVWSELLLWTCPQALICQWVPTSRIGGKKQEKCRRLGQERVLKSLIILVTLQLWKEKQEWFQQWCYSHARPHELCKRIFRFWVVATDKELGALRSSSFWPPRFILRSGCSDLFCLFLWLLRLCKNFCPILIHWQVTLLWVVLKKMEPNNVQGDFMSRYASTFSKAYDCMCKCR